MNPFTRIPSRRYLVHLSRASTIPFFISAIRNPLIPQSFTNLKQQQLYSSKQTPRMSPSPTFQLWEFTHFDGCDMHVLVLLQQTSNASALANLRHNLRHSIASGQVNVWPREYTLQDVVNIQTSAVDLIMRFAYTSDNVDLVVASGKLDVEQNEADAETTTDEAEWFERALGDTKFPLWEKLGGKVVSMLEGKFEPEELE